MKAEVSVMISSIEANPYNSRGKIDIKSQSFKELVDSITKFGVQVPVMLRKKGNKLILLAGSRRMLAATVAGLKAIPAIVYEGLTDQEAFDKTMAENAARKDLTIVEKIRSYEFMIDRYGYDVPTIAAKLEVTHAEIYRYNHLQMLSPEWKKTINDDEIDMTIPHLALISRLPQDTQDRILSERWKLYPSGNLISVAGLVKLINELTFVLRTARFDIVGCAGCKNRNDSVIQEVLWADDKTAIKDARCLCPACWTEKTRSAIAAKIKKLADEGTKVIAIHAEYDVPELFQEAKHTHEFRKPTKQDKPEDIVTVVHIDGPKIGTSEKAVPVKSFGTENKKDKKVKEAGLENKRWNEIRLRVMTLLDNGSHEDLSSKRILCLAATFGTLSFADRIFDDKKSRWDNICNEDDAFKVLLMKTKQVLVRRLNYKGPASTMHQRYTDEIKSVCGYFSIDWKKIYDEVKVSKGFTVPKSWKK